MLQIILSKLLTIIVFFIIFTIIVVSHEFGHFLVGRLNGIRVNEFAIGMGPVIFKKRLKSTVLTIHLLPIGGACVFYSDDITMGGDFKDDEDDKYDDEQDDTQNGNEDDSQIKAESKEALDTAMEEPEDEYTKGLPGDKFGKAPIWGRIATVLAGPFFNFITAYLMCVFMVWFCGQDLPIVNGVVEGYPAYEAGIQKGDKIVKINGDNIYLWRDVSLISMMNYGEPLNIVYERDGQKYQAQIIPQYDPKDDRHYIGFSGGQSYVECNNLSVFKYSYYEERYWFLATFKSLGYLFKGHGSMDDFSGPVGIATVIDDTIENTRPMGMFVVILNIVNIATLLSVNIGILNLLPFPAIDGGRLMFLLFELITGKKVPPDKEGLVHLAGFVILFIFMIIVFFNDIWRVVGRFF